jgi:ankyrin repeat protein
MLLFLLLFLSLLRQCLACDTIPLMKVEDIIKLEQPPPKVLELLNEQVGGFDAVKWRDQATGESTLHLAIEAGRLKLVKLLLETGCDVDATDLEGCTPLWSACRIGRLDMVKVMVGHGADVHKATHILTLTVPDGEKSLSVPIHGITALACALFYRHMEIVAYLVKQGVRLNSTALALATKADVATVKVRTDHMKENYAWEPLSHTQLRMAVMRHPFSLSVCLCLCVCVLYSSSLN